MSSESRESPGSIMSTPPPSSFVYTPCTPEPKKLEEGELSHALYNDSSPLKSAYRRLISRNAIEESKHAQSKETDPQFVENHLNLPQGHKLEVSDQDPRILTIRAATSKSNVIYTPLSSLLTELSENTYNGLPEDERPDSPIVFLDHHENTPTSHPYKAKDRPDLLAVPGPISKYEQVEKRTDYREVRHYRVISLVECKPFKENGRAQAASYAFQLLEARPDMPGVYVLWAQPTGYQILWSDAAGIAASEFLSWDNLVPLAAYLYSLYVPPESHFLYDPTITLPESEDKIKGFDQIQWTIKAHLPEPYLGCRSVFVGTPWARRTNVWTHGSTKEKSVIVIKDSFVDNNRRYTEEMLLERIHKNGTYPGVVRLIKAVDFETPITTAQPVTKSYTRLPERTRTRLVMGSYGVSLKEAKSVKHILMAVYDIVEIHRGLIKDSVGVLHRDISSHNILMYPFHHPETNGTSVQDPPLFIKQVLNTDEMREGSDNAIALLIDFDNGAFIPTSLPQPHPNPVDASDSEISEELASRTGTPMFIARSVSRGSLLSGGVPSLRAQMPELTPLAKKLYIDAYTEHTYNSYSDREGHIHGRASPIFDAEIPAQKKFYHRPDHDIESVFWVLLAALMRAQPQSRSNDDKLGLGNYWDAYDGLLNHTIQGAKNYDSRSPLLAYSTLEFKAILDPKLASLAPMLRKMAGQIAPEYGFLDPPPAREHLHEAMRRLLLEEIVRMNNENDSILLEAGTSRPPRPKEKPKKSAPTTQLESEGSAPERKLKRGSDNQGATSNTKNKKSRSTYGDDGLRQRYLE